MIVFTTYKTTDDTPVMTAEEYEKADKIWIMISTADIYHAVKGTWKVEGKHWRDGAAEHPYFIKLTLVVNSRRAEQVSSNIEKYILK